MESLFHYLESVHPLSKALENELVRRLHSRIFRKKEFLLKEGHVSKNIYFIDAGLVRSFYSNGSREVSVWFMKEGDVVVSINSFFLQIPSSESIQAIESTTVQYISYEELEFLYRTFLSFNIHARKILTYYYCLSEQRAILIRAMKAKDRFTWLIRKEPGLMQRVPRKFIASYLGVSQSTLHRIYKLNRLIGPSNQQRFNGASS